MMFTGGAQWVYPLLAVHSVYDYYKSRPFLLMFMYFYFIMKQFRHKNLFIERQSHCSACFVRPQV